MSTVAEIMMFMQAIEPEIDKISFRMQLLYGDMIEEMLMRMTGREVSAKRMRTLQRRGAVIRFSRYTSTGKRRYKWLPAKSARFGTFCESSAKTFDVDHKFRQYPVC